MTLLLYTCIRAPLIILLLIGLTNSLIFEILRHVNTEEEDDTIASSGSIDVDQGQSESVSQSLFKINRPLKEERFPRKPQIPALSNWSLRKYFYNWQLIVFVQNIQTKLMMIYI